jgi:hypothetical protein
MNIRSGRIILTFNVFTKLGYYAFTMMGPTARYKLTALPISIYARSFADVEYPYNTDQITPFSVSSLRRIIPHCPHLDGTPEPQERRLRGFTKHEDAIPSTVELCRFISGQFEQSFRTRQLIRQA